MNERRGFLRVTVDGGREAQTIPLRVRMADSVSATPTTIVLGQVAVSAAHVKSAFPARVTLQGDSLSANSVVLKHLPPVLGNPRLVRASDQEWTLDCEIVISAETSEVQGVVLLEVVSHSQDILQVLEIPVVGFIKHDK